MAYVVMAYVAMVHIVMAYVATVHIVMAYVATVHIVMAYVARVHGRTPVSSGPGPSRECRRGARPDLRYLKL